MTARDRLVSPNAIELALERPVVVELSAPYNFYGAQGAKPRMPRQPDFAIAPAADGPKQFVIGNVRRRAFAAWALRVVCGNGFRHGCAP